MNGNCVCVGIFFPDDDGQEEELTDGRQHESPEEFQGEFGIVGLV